VIQRIHITGGPGSGKTTAARRIAEGLNLPFHELDQELDQILNDSGGDMERSHWEDRARTMADQGAWVSDGAYLDWVRPFLERAELVLWLDPPWRVACFRILVRHLKAELKRQNQYPGWRRLGTFWRWSYRYYRDANPHSLNPWGVPLTRSLAVEELSQYERKLVVCRSKHDVDLQVSELVGRTTLSPR
jgi:adenylate kinase family enzyme